jgi:hypothetical protein
MLGIADARFQDTLLKQAKGAGKIEKDYVLPVKARNNTPDFLASALGPAQKSGLLPAFPFGTDFTQEEQRLLPALKILKQASPMKLVALVAAGLSAGRSEGACLARMGLDRPSGLKERLYAALVRGALARAS